MRMGKKINAFLLCLVCLILAFFLDIGAGIRIESASDVDPTVQVIADEREAWDAFAAVVKWNSEQDSFIMLNLDYYENEKHRLHSLFNYISNGGSVPTQEGCSEERFVFLTCYLLAGHYYVVHQDYTNAMTVLDYVYQHPQYIQWAYDNLRYEWFDAQYLYGYSCAVQMEHTKAIDCWQEMMLHLDQFPVVRPANPDTFINVYSDLRELVSWKNGIRGEIILASEENAVNAFLKIDGAVPFNKRNSINSRYILASILLASGLYDAALDHFSSLVAEIDDIDSHNMRARVLCHLAQATRYANNDIKNALEFLEAAEETCPVESFDIHLDIRFWTCCLLFEAGDIEGAQDIAQDILSCESYFLLSDQISQKYIQNLQEAQR